MENSIHICSLEFYQTFASDQMAFAYLGPISDDITDLIIETNIEYIPPQKPITLKRRFSFLLAESFQNLIRHTNKDSKEDFSDVFFLSTQRNNIYFINSINKVTKQEEIGLTEKLESINNIEPENLRQLYLNLLNNAEFNSHGGAGLGFIEMVRKSGQKLQFSFQNLSGNASLFVLQLLLNGSKEPAIPHDKQLALDIYQGMRQKKMIFAFKGRYIDTCMPVSLQAVRKILSIINISNQSIDLLSTKVQHLILINNELQRKYNRYIHFIITIRKHDDRGYIFTMCSELLSTHLMDYEPNDIKILNSNGFSTCVNEINNSNWISLVSKLE